MRVLHAVTLVSPDAAYGGPVRVATNQCAALADLGHHPVIAGGMRGFGRVPETLRGTPAQLFPAQRILPKVGFAGLTSTKFLRWFLKHYGEFDLVHVHLARDLVTLPIAWAAIRVGLPLVVQTHGMIDQSANVLAGPLDQFFTKPILRKSRAVLYLTDHESRDLEGLAGREARLLQLINGVPPRAASLQHPHREGVVFLGRLHRRKQPQVFVNAARQLSSAHPTVDFQLIGPDEGEGVFVSKLLTAPDACRVSWSGPISPELVLERLSRAQLYVLPSLDEPFPMSVLEAMSVGTPVVVTRSCGLARTIEDRKIGAVTDGTTASLVQAIDRLLSSPAELAAMGARAERVAVEDFSITAVAERLVEIYQGVREA